MSPPISIFCDFDGTITKTDSLKHLLRTYGGSSWRRLEKQMMTGQVMERDALRSAFGSFQLSQRELELVIANSVYVDPHFVSFANWVNEQSIDFTILSGGFESIIDQVFRREQWPIFPRIANQLIVDQDGWTVNMVSPSPACGRCSHCKGDTLRAVRQNEPHQYLIYIGDGISDLCALQVADHVIAKDFLADYCERLGISFSRFDSFSEVRSIVEELCRSSVEFLSTSSKELQKFSAV